MKIYAITQYRDGMSLANIAATATHADLISICRYWKILIPICDNIIAAEWRLK